MSRVFKTRFLTLKAATVFCPLFFTPAAQAQEKPLITPARDVDVTYDVTRPDQQRTSKRVRWLVSEDLERVDSPDRSATIFDRRRNEIIVLNPASRTLVMLEGAPPQLPVPTTGETLKRVDSSIVAGLPCINWMWAVDAQIHTVCLTSDGVLLRLVVDGKTTLLARSVAYGPQKADLFEVPPSYVPAFVSGTDL